MRRINSMKVKSSCRILFLVGLLLAALAVAIVMWGNRHASWPTHPDLVEISQSTGIKFPKSAKLQGSHLGIFTTMELSAKIDIDQSDINMVAAQFPHNQYAKPAIVQPMLEKYAPNYPWWDPESARKPMVFVDESRRLCASISLVGNGRATIYMLKRAK